MFFPSKKLIQNTGRPNFPQARPSENVWHCRNLAYSKQNCAAALATRARAISPGDMLALYFLLSAVTAAYGKVVDFEAAGGKAEDASESVEWSNGRLLNQTLGSLQAGDTLLVPNKSFHVMGGIQAKDLQSVVIQIDGTLIFSARKKDWPRHSGGGVLSCLRFEDVTNLTLTSSKQGVLDGQGKAWWGYIEYLEIQENRPRLLEMSQIKGVLVENLLLTNSPYWTSWFSGVDGLEIRHSEIVNKRSGYKGHDFYNLGAFNTEPWPSLKCYHWTGHDAWILPLAGETAVILW